jgi:hypothetical protein
MHIIKAGVQFKFLIFIFVQRAVNGGQIRLRKPTTAYILALAATKFQ